MKKLIETKKAQLLTAVVATLAASVAHAGIAPMNGVAVEGDSSVLLVMLDSTGPQTRGLTVDLGFTFSQFNASGALSAPGQQVIWDLANNTSTHTSFALNHVLGQSVKAGAWSSQVEDFFAHAQPNETRWALVAGSAKDGIPRSFLATGTPTTAQRNAQNASATAAFMQVDSLFLTNDTLGTHAEASDGAYSAAALGAASVGVNYAASTAIGGWKNNLRWMGWTALGGSTNLWQLNANGSELAVGELALWESTGLLNDMGTLTMSADGRILTWSTTPVPEPGAWALALAGGLLVLARRRRRSL